MPLPGGLTALLVAPLQIAAGDLHVPCGGTVGLGNVGFFPDPVGDLAVQLPLVDEMEADLADQFPLFLENNGKNIANALLVTLYHKWNAHGCIRLPVRVGDVDDLIGDLSIIRIFYECGEILDL